MSNGGVVFLFQTHTDNPHFVRVGALDNPFHIFIFPLGTSWASSPTFYAIKNLPLRGAADIVG